MRVFLLIWLCIMVTSARCQDLVVTPEGDSLNCRITKVRNGNVYFIFKHKGEVRSTLLPVDQAKYSYRFYSNTEVSIHDNAVVSEQYTKWRLALNGGISFRTAGIPEGYSEPVRDYLKELKSGYQFGAEVTRFISESLGIGVEYRSFVSKNKADNMSLILPDGSSFTGSISDNITISYLGASTSTQFVGGKKKGALLLGFTLGYLGYKDVATLDNSALRITGGTFGLGFGISYDWRVAGNLGLGLGVSMITGTLTRVELNNGYSSVKVKLDKGQYESLSRVDISIGLRFYR